MNKNKSKKQYIFTKNNFDEVSSQINKKLEESITDENPIMPKKISEEFVTLLKNFSLNQDLDENINVLSNRILMQNANIKEVAKFNKDLAMGIAIEMAETILNPVFSYLKLYSPIGEIGLKTSIEKRSPHVECTTLETLSQNIPSVKSVSSDFDFKEVVSSSPVSSDVTIPPVDNTCLGTSIKPIKSTPLLTNTGKKNSLLPYDICNPDSFNPLNRSLNLTLNDETYTDTINLPPSIFVSKFSTATATLTKENTITAPQAISDTLLHNINDKVTPLTFTREKLFVEKDCFECVDLSNSFSSSSSSVPGEINNDLSVTNYTKSGLIPAISTVIKQHPSLNKFEAAQEMSSR